MKDLGVLQKTVLEKAKQAMASGDGTALGILGPILSQMDEMHDKWIAASGPGSIRSHGSPAAEHLSIPNGRGTTSNSRVDVTGRRLRSARLFGRSLQVASYKDLLFAVIQQLLEKYPREFDSRAPLVSGRHPYFSASEKELRSPEKIQGSSLCVETNLNSNLIVDICRRLLEAMGCSAEELEVDVEPFRSRGRDIDI